MATPSWDVLHTRLASSLRDSVSSASVNGSELFVADRDAYLNYAYQKYVRLVMIYNPSSVGRILPELFNIASLVSSSGGAITAPPDFGYYLSMDRTDVSNAVLTRPPPETFNKIKYTKSIQSPPASDNVFINIEGSIINTLPAEAGNYDLGYIIKPVNITQGGVDDIVISSEHWDTVIALARAQYFRDKQEFAVAQSVETDAIINAPFKIGEVKN